MTPSGSHLVGVVDSLDPFRHPTSETTTATTVDVATGSVIGERLLPGPHKRVSGVSIFPDVLVIQRRGIIGVSGVSVSEHPLFAP